MKTFFKYAMMFIAVLTSVALLSSCGDDEKEIEHIQNPEPPGSLSLSAYECSFTYFGLSVDSQPITVNSNEKWTVSSDCSWIECSNPNWNNQIDIKVIGDNNSFETRTGTVTVSTSSATSKISVKQMGKKLISGLYDYTITYNREGIATSYTDEDGRTYTSSNGRVYSNSITEDDITTTTKYDLTKDRDNKITKAVITIEEKEGRDYVQETHNLTFEYNNVNNLVKITDSWTQKERYDGETETDDDVETVTYNYQVMTDDDPSCSLYNCGVIKGETAKWADNSKQRTVSYTIGNDRTNYHKMYLPCFMNQTPGINSSLDYDLTPFAMMGLLGDFSIDVPTSYTISASGVNSSKTIPSITVDKNTYLITKYGNESIKYWPE